MKIFGNKEVFAIAYELKKSPFKEQMQTDLTWGTLQMWVFNQSVCTFIKDNQVYEYEWDLIFIVEWLYKNKKNIFNDTQFPLPVEGRNALELYNNSGKFDSDDDCIFNLWFEKRQDWYFKHSWYSNNGGSYLAEVIFRRVEDTIEIAWDNTALYDQIKFSNPKGVCYIPIDLFGNVVDDFINAII